MILERHVPITHHSKFYTTPRDSEWLVYCSSTSRVESLPGTSTTVVYPFTWWNFCFPLAPPSSHDFGFASVDKFTMTLTAVGVEHAHTFLLSPNIFIRILILYICILTHSWTISNTIRCPLQTVRPTSLDEVYLTSRMFIRAPKCHLS